MNLLFRLLSKFLFLWLLLSVYFSRQFCFLKPGLTHSANGAHKFWPGARSRAPIFSLPFQVLKPPISLIGSGQNLSCVWWVVAQKRPRGIEFHSPRAFPLWSTWYVNSQRMQRTQVYLLKSNRVSGPSAVYSRNMKN